MNYVRQTTCNKLFRPVDKLVRSTTPQSKKAFEQEISIARGKNPLIRWPLVLLILPTRYLTYDRVGVIRVIDALARAAPGSGFKESTS